MSKRHHLVISEKAREDLNDIWQYITLDSMENVDNFVDLIYEKCADLAAFPEMGRRRDELLPGIRSLPVKRYVVFYRIKEDYIEIARILSAYRNMGSVF